MNDFDEAPGSSFLNLEELYDVHKKKDVNKIEVYRRIYQRCQDKIRKTNDQLGKMDCLFEVPTFLWGTPIYDYDDLKSYIIYRLSENGITHCYFVDQNNLYISWRPQHIDKKRYRSAKRKYGLGDEEETPSETDSLSPGLGGGPGGRRRANYRIDRTGWDDSVANYGKPKKGGKSAAPPGPPPSGTMQFDSEIGIPVNMDKIRLVQGPVTSARGITHPRGRLGADEDDYRPRGSDFGSTRTPDTEGRALPSHSERRPPNRHMLTSWHKYFSKMQQPQRATNMTSWANPYL